MVTAMKYSKEYEIGRHTYIVMRGSQKLLRHPFLFLKGKIMNEANYRRGLTQKLKLMFPGCHVMKLDPSETQGIPDILILFEDKWAALEVKFGAVANEQPNQRYYVDKFDEMSFAAFIHPQNEEQVLHDLQSTFGVSGKTCVSKS